MAGKNSLFYGDNLDVLRRYIKDESVDLVYLDPPFNSNASYNVLFAERDGAKAAAQMQAFEDTWVWDETAYASFTEMVEKGGPVSDTLQAFHMVLKNSNMMAYLSMMAPRLVELHRVLKSSGSLYLHCDPTASHYLKLLMDSIFGPDHFGNEIIWKRTNSKGLAFVRFASNHDTILRYTKTNKWVWNPQYIELDQEYTDKFYRFIDENGRRYQLADLTNPNPNRPNLTYEFLGITRVWRWTRERMEEAYKKGLVVQSSPGSVPRLKRFLDEQEGKPIDDVWIDIKPVQSGTQERMGYPTQKPQSLLERIIQASSNPDDVVLDPFCGCGTAVVAAQKLGRRWIGIDITHVAINLIRKRVKDSFSDAEFRVIGEPTTKHDAEELAQNDPYQFQWWALGLVGARPTEGKKGADQGIDGRLFFHDDNSGKTKQVIFSVKAGGLHSNYVRDLRGVIEREKAAIGVMLTFQEPTKPMRSEAAEAGYYQSPLGSKHPRIQILTIGELLSGKQIDMPRGRVEVTFKRAPKQKKDQAQQMGLLDDSIE